MPKKMARLDESWDFRPFKFRIQAFTNSFTEWVRFRSFIPYNPTLARADCIALLCGLQQMQADGIHEDLMSAKKVKLYLWNQPYIARFNDDGKKAKSKGNHIWNVDARKLPGGGWEFRQLCVSLFCPLPLPLRVLTVVPMSHCRLQQPEDFASVPSGGAQLAPVQLVAPDLGPSHAVGEH